MYKAMDALGLDKDVFFRIPADIIHLGNIAFESVKDGEASNIRNDTDTRNEREASRSPIDVAADLLGVEPSSLQRALTLKSLKSARRTSVVMRDLTVTQAKENRDALCKALYSRMFDDLVYKVNVALQVYISL